MDRDKYQITQVALFYHLLKPVSRSIALVMVCLNLSACVIKTLSRLSYIAPLIVLGGPQYLSIFKAEQLQALPFLFLKVNDQAAAIALIFSDSLRSWKAT